MSDSVRPHRWQPTRLPCPWNSPGKNTRVGCHFLLQCMKVKSESEVTQSCPTLGYPMDCSLPGSSVHGIFRQEYWGGVPLSRVVITFLPRSKRLSDIDHTKYVLSLQGNRKNTQMRSNQSFCKAKERKKRKFSCSVMSD